MALVSKVQKCQLLSFVALVLLLFLTASYFKTKIDQLSVGCSSKEARTDLPIFTKIAGWLKTFFTHFVDNPVTDSTDDGPDLACDSSLSDSIAHIMMYHIVQDIRKVCVNVAEILNHAAEKSSVWLNENSGICVAVSSAAITFSCLLFVCLYWKRKKEETPSIIQPRFLEYKDRNFTNDGLEFDSRKTALFSPLSVLRQGCCGPAKSFGSHTGMWVFHPQRTIAFLAFLLVCISVPWEFLRLYQKAIGDRAAVASVGLPAECQPAALSLLQTLRMWLSRQLAWSHGNPCDRYYYAVFVDPLWEITPFMVLMSVATRCIVHPAEMLLSGLGRGLRHFFTEIPVHWQPVFLLIILTTLLITLLMTCSYRISVPLLFRIEPRTPVLAGTACSGGCRVVEGGGGKAVRSGGKERENSVLCREGGLNELDFKLCSCDSYLETERAHDLKYKLFDDENSSLGRHFSIDNGATKPKPKGRLSKKDPDEGVCTTFDDVDKVCVKRAANTKARVASRAPIHELSGDTNDSVGRRKKASQSQKRNASSKSPSRRRDGR